MEIVIGTKAWSTWSMRPWLVLKHVGAPFSEVLIELRQEGATQAAIAAHSPSGLVPALKVDGVVICDSLAICEFLAERFPDAGLWPADPLARALARSAVSEMHGGFQSLRGECPMDLAMTPHHPTLSPATEANIRRIVRLWSDLLARSGGPFLCGEWGIVDAFFTPVASRFHTYCVRLSDYGDVGPAGGYCERLLETPEFKAWAVGA